MKDNVRFNPGDKVQLTKDAITGNEGDIGTIVKYSWLDLYNVAIGNKIRQVSFAHMKSYEEDITIAALGEIDSTNKLNQAFYNIEIQKIKSSIKDGNANDAENKLTELENQVVEDMDEIVNITKKLINKIGDVPNEENK